MRSSRWRGVQGKLIGKLVVPCADTIAWAMWYENAGKQRIVGSDEIGPLHVSTIFLGLDHGFGGKSKWFETMIFGDRDQLIELAPGKKHLFRTTLPYERRYETWAEAEEGHREACEWAREHLAALDIKLTVKHD